MREPTRRKPPHELAVLIDAAITHAHTAADPWPALERAHIASQPWAWPHTRVHAAMLRVAWRARDRHEVIGQALRLLLAAPGSLTGRYPPGNTGRSTMGLTTPGPVPDDLGAHLPSHASTAR